MLTQRTLEGRAAQTAARPSNVISSRRSNTFFKLALFVLAIAMVFAVSTASIASATSTGDTANSRGVTSLLRSANRLNVTLTGFSPTLGATRTEVEELFHYIDKRTIFKVASKIKGVPRTLGQDKGLYTAVEINGYPEVVDVQVVSILDTSSKTILEGQVAFDSLTCREFSSKAAQKWCTGRILNTNANGLVTATNSKTFDGLRITVRTYRSSASSSAPVVSIDVSAI
jgi:hypothetical protein